MSWTNVESSSFFLMKRSFEVWGNSNDEALSKLGEKMAKVAY